MSKKDSYKFMKDVRDASQDEFILSEWEADKMAELVKQESIKYAHKEGIEQGIEQNNSFIIQNLLRRKMNYEDIQDITGTSIEEIKEIENSMYE